MARASDSERSVRLIYVNATREWGGAEAWSADFALGMAERGHETTLVCHPNSELARRVGSHPRLRLAPVALRGEVAPMKVLRLARIFRRARPDVIAVYRTRYVKPSVVANALAGHFPLVHVHHAPNPLRDGIFYRLLWPRGVRAMVVVSEEMRRLLLDRTPWLAPIPIETIHNGVNVDIFRPRAELRLAVRHALGIPEDAFVVSYHGSIEPRKRVEVIVDAIARSAKENRVHGLIIGGGSDEEPIRRRAAELNAPITFTGRRGDIPELLSASDVALHMSIAEGFPLSVIEAMACGLPIIASDATSHSEAVKHGIQGLLVQRDSVGELAAAILRLCRDGDKRGHLARAARQRAVHEFNQSVMLERYETLLERVAGEAAASV